jgi:hypothetical protein
MRSIRSALAAELIRSIGFFSARKQKVTFAGRAGYVIGINRAMDMDSRDCIFPDCQIRTELGGRACEHSCEWEQIVKAKEKSMTTKITGPPNQTN